jgi:hypothetical protein
LVHANAVRSRWKDHNGPSISTGEMLYGDTGDGTADMV